MSYSLLKNLDFSPRYAKSILEGKKTKKSPELIFGDLVDCLVFTPEIYDNKFIVSNVSKPTGQMEIFTDYLIEANATATNFESIFCYEDAYKAILIKENKIKLQAGLDKFIERFKIEGKPYFDFAIQSTGKDILSIDDYQKAIEIKSILTTNLFTNKYFNIVNLKEYQEIVYQYSLYFLIDEIECKGLPDILDFDHYSKTIRYIDLKTTYKSIYDFSKTFIFYKYYLICFNLII